MKKIFLAIAVIIVFGVISFYAFNTYIYNEKQAQPGEEIKSYKGTLTGQYVCLPHKDTSTPQTEECRYGMQTEAGDYYVVDFNLYPGEAPNLQQGERFTATGTITPIEMLSTDIWNKYAVKGIFSVTEPITK